MAGHTLMLAENIAACNHTYSGTAQTTQLSGMYWYGWADQSLLQSGSGATNGDARRTGFMWFCGNKTDATAVANPATTSVSDIGNDPRATGPYYARPSSFHAQGGVNVVFCDGHSQFLRKDIARVVYWHLMCPDPKNAIVPNNNSMTNVSSAYFRGDQQFTPLSDTDFSAF